MEDHDAKEEDAEMMRETVALTQREMKRWLRAWYALVITFITPLFWIGLYGKSFNFASIFTPDRLPPQFEAIASNFGEITNQMIKAVFGTEQYFTYIASGMLAVFVLFTTMFNGMSLVWDRRFGFLTKLLVAPIPRESIFVSRMISGVIRGLLQVTVVLAIAALLGLQFGPGYFSSTSTAIINTLGVFAALALLAVAFSSIFTALATSVTQMETLFAVANLVNLPLMFTSNALFPVNAMPDWLRAIAHVNPITYASNIVRDLIFMNTTFEALSYNFFVLGIFALASFVVGTLIFRSALNRG